MRLSPTIIEALQHRSLFSGMFDADSWSKWKVFLKAIYALPLTDDEMDVFKYHTGRSIAPTTPSRYAQFVCGRRAGKSRILALLATYLGCVIDHTPHLVPGENAVIAIIAKDRDQAKVIKNYITGLMKAVPVLADMIEDELAETIRLSNNVVVEVHTASIGAPRGRTFLAVLCDEAAFWNSTADSANPDIEVINAVRPGLSTIPYSLLLIASSPYAKRGILYQNYAKYFGRDDAPVLVFQGSTEEMNATQIGEPLISEMYLEDPERASAEFGAQFRSDIVAFITREAVEDCVARGVRELPPGGGITFYGATDPSGGSADSMTLAISHMEADGVAVLDALREVKPPFSPDAVVEEFAALLKSYGISRVTGDAYAGEWPRERFAVHGISYEVSKKNKNTIYSEFLPALNGKRVRLLDVPRLIGQLCGLERRVARGGRDSIDHAPGGAHDDLANSAAMALVQVINDRRPALVKSADLLVADAPAPLPLPARAVFATMAVGRDGQVGVVFIASGIQAGAVILDFFVAPLSGAIFSEIAESLSDLARQTHARLRPHLFVQPDLLRSSLASGVYAVEVPEVLRDAERLLMGTAARIARGDVKLAAAAHTRGETSPLAGALDVRGGDLADDPLRRATVWAISLALDAE